VRSRKAHPHLRSALRQREACAGAKVISAQREGIGKTLLSGSENLVLPIRIGLGEADQAGEEIRRCSDAADISSRAKHSYGGLDGIPSMNAFIVRSWPSSALVET
jgi:hypothetical protein